MRMKRSRARRRPPDCRLHFRRHRRCLLEVVRDVTDGDLWLQLYVQENRRIAENMMARARAAKFSTLLLTVDTPVLGQRDDYVRTGFKMPLRWTPRLVWDIVTHPRWLATVGIYGQPRLVNLSRSAQLGAGIEDRMGASTHRMDQTLNWRDIAWLRTHWDGKIFLKGIQTVEDARTAFRHEVDGIVLSNHGGRQLDGARSPLDILAQTVSYAPRSAEVLAWRHSARQRHREGHSAGRAWRLAWPRAAVWPGSRWASGRLRRPCAAA
jgi:(S)-mandelate dehydrogenase